MTTEINVKSSPYERYDTDLVDRIDAVLRDIEGITVVYREGGCSDGVNWHTNSTGADNMFGIEGDRDAIARALAAVQATAGRTATATVVNALPRPHIGFVRDEGRWRITCPGCEPAHEIHSRSYAKQWGAVTRATRHVRYHARQQGIIL